MVQTAVYVRLKGLGSLNIIWFLELKTSNVQLCDCNVMVTIKGCHWGLLRPPVNGVTSTHQYSKTPQLPVISFSTCPVCLVILLQNQTISDFLFEVVYLCFDVTGVLFVKNVILLSLVFGK